MPPLFSSGLHGVRRRNRLSLEQFAQIAFSQGLMGEQLARTAILFSNASRVMMKRCFSISPP
jgi:hypothetical protein